MQLGFCMLESGLVRSKHTINVALKNLLDFCIAALLYWALAFGVMFGNGSDWMGTSGFLYNAGTDAGAWAYFLFQMMFCATAATIVSGAIAERMSFYSYLWVTVLVSAIVYPFFGHWAWAESGWLAKLGFVDFAGSTVVHGVGGWMALAAAIVVGPRLGRFTSTMRLASSHSLGTSTFGVLVLFVAWLGFNGGSGLALTDRVPLILVNTVLAGAAGAMAGLFLNWRLEKLPTLPPTLNGCLAGLVAVTAGCHVFSPALAVMVGAAGGVICVFASKLQEHWKIDDVVGAWAVHGAAGVWGTLAVGLFAPLALLETGHDRLTQIGVQLLGITVAALWAGGVGWLLLTGLNRLSPLRVDAEGERLGLNVAEHGASTEVIDLLMEMGRHSGQGDFTQRLQFEPFTEVGQIASEYNRVIDKVVDEMELREQVASRLDEEREVMADLHGKLIGSLEYAKRIQEAALPTTETLAQIGSESWVVYLPRDVVSGDFYWCDPADESGIALLALADCTGHGVPGAFMSIMGISLLNQIVHGEGLRDPGVILSRLHSLTRRSLGQNRDGNTNLDGMDIALVAIEHDSVRFAGARRPLWISSTPDSPKAPTGIQEIRGERRSIGGGRFEPPNTQFQTQRIPRHPGMTFYLFSDGITDQPNHLREPFDKAPLKKMIASWQGSAVSARPKIFQETLAVYCGGTAQRDDITFLAIHLD